VQKMSNNWFGSVTQERPDTTSIKRSKPQHRESIITEPTVTKGITPFLPTQRINFNYDEEESTRSPLSAPIPTPQQVNKVMETVPRPKKQPSPQIKLVNRASAHMDSVTFQAFPHPHTPLYGDFLSWAAKGAYFVMYDKNGKDGYDYRYWHKQCPGVYGSPSKAEMIEASKREAVLVLNFTQYPILMSDNEWPAVLKRHHADYLVCTCPWHRYVPHGEDVKRVYYEIRKPYFYLTGLNEEGEDCLRRTRLLSEVR